MQIMFGDEYVNEGNKKVITRLMTCSYLGVLAPRTGRSNWSMTLQGRYRLDLNGRHGIQTRHENMGVEHVTEG